MDKAWKVQPFTVSKRKLCITTIQDERAPNELQFPQQDDSKHLQARRHLLPSYDFIIVGGKVLFHCYVPSAPSDSKCRIGGHCYKGPCKSINRVPATRTFLY